MNHIYGGLLLCLLLLNGCGEPFSLTKSPSVDRPQGKDLARAKPEILGAALISPVKREVIDITPLFSHLPAELKMGRHWYDSRETKARKILEHLPGYKKGMSERLEGIKKNLQALGQGGAADDLMPEYISNFWNSDFMTKIPNFSELSYEDKEKFIDQGNTISPQAITSLKKSILFIEKMQEKILILSEAMSEEKNQSTDDEEQNRLGELIFNSTNEYQALTYLIQRSKEMINNK